jgi:hypothetical protein
MSKTVKRALIATSALALAFTAQITSASAITIHPMSFDECGTNSDGWYNCMYINGGGLYASEVRGWSHQTNSKVLPWGSLHEEITVNGNLYCNGPETTATTVNSIVNCQTTPNANIAAGQYCAILWAYDAAGGVYTKEAENCGTVSA